MNVRIARIVVRIVAPAVTLSLALAGCARQATVDGSDWPNFGRDGSEQHYSPLNEITLDNVGKLSLAWHYDLEPGFTVSTPVAADGKLFVTTGHSHIRAFDAATGKLLWEYDAKTREIAQIRTAHELGQQGHRVLRAGACSLQRRTVA